MTKSANEERKTPESFIEACRTNKIPDFPNKGMYRTWSKSWDKTGYSTQPQYPGDIPIRFPEDWSPWERFMLNHLADPL